MFENKQDFVAWYERSPAGRRCSTATDKASDSDREWFENNPGEDSYIRDPFPDEFPPMPAGQKIEAVLVRQIKPGVRMRMPVTESLD